MSDFFQLVDQNNRIQYKSLVEYILKSDIINFAFQVKVPFFLGKDLFDGSLVTHNTNRNNATFLFRARQNKRIKSGGPDMMSRVVYILLKTQQADDEERNIISIGRGSGNDITIVDYAISKNHAKIIREGGRYFLQDNGSTNGIEVNNRTVPYGHKVQLYTGDLVNFGRLQFVFANPLDFFLRVKRIFNQGTPPKIDILKVIKALNHKDLLDIASRNKLDLPRKPSKAIILSAFYQHMEAEQLIQELSQAPLFS